MDVDLDALPATLFGVPLGILLEIEPFRAIVGAEMHRRGDCPCSWLALQGYEWACVPQAAESPPAPLPPVEPTPTTWVDWRRS